MLFDCKNVEHLMLTLSVPLGKLDFNLPATHPLPVQAVKSIFCVAHVLKYAGWLRVLIALILARPHKFK